MSFVDAFTKSDFQGPDLWTSITDVDWTDTGTLTVTGGVIPEPGSITMLVGLGLTSLFLYRWRRKR